MSNKYKHGDTIPDQVLIDRLKELAKAVTKGPNEVRREFSMRVPAERDRDADLVLSEAAHRIAALADRDARVCDAQRNLLVETRESLEFMLDEYQYIEGADGKRSCRKCGAAEDHECGMGCPLGNARATLATGLGR